MREPQAIPADVPGGQVASNMVPDDFLANLQAANDLIAAGQQTPAVPPSPADDYLAQTPERVGQVVSDAQEALRRQAQIDEGRAIDLQSAQKDYEDGSYSRNNPSSTR